MPRVRLRSRAWERVTAGTMDIMSPGSTRPPHALWTSRFISEVDPSRIALIFVLSVALAARVWNLATHTYVIWPDETFQYLEPAHRLAFGSGIISWEYIYGIRSWLLPGVIAVAMRLISLVDPDPQGYVSALRFLCALASLSVPFVGFKLAERRLGLPAAVLTGLLCALGYQLVYFAPVIMTEPLATDLSLLAIWIGGDAYAGRNSFTRLLVAGLLFGLASSLRYQYAPVLGVIILLQHWRDRRSLAVVAAGAATVVLLVLGLLDTLTWGRPFQSVWLNYKYNAVDGVSSAMGTARWFTYPLYYIIAWGALAPVILALAIYGAAQVPVLASIVVCVIGLHSLVPHKELRLVFMATACMPILIGIGLGGVLQGLRRRWQSASNVATAVALAIVISASTAIAAYKRASPPDDWHRDRAMLEALSVARAVPGACAAAIRSLAVYRTGGYSYFHRDIPIYFESWDSSQTIDGTDQYLPLANVLNGKPVPQYPDALLSINTNKFNVMIGSPDDGLPGFSRQNCFGSEWPGEKRYCVFVRPGGCS